MQVDSSVQRLPRKMRAAAPERKTRDAAAPADADEQAGRRSLEDEQAADRRGLQRAGP
jgi:hypothetical protein